jgi:bacteriorhodopsin
MNGAQLRLVRRTTWTSIIVQLVTGIVLLAALLSGRGSSMLRSLLALEACVQGVELVFYLYIVRTLTSHASVRSMAAKRYADWFITTPVMLVTLAAYFTAGDASQAAAGLTLGPFLAQNRDELLLMVGANIAMLLFGLLGELGVIGLWAATLAGFLAFAVAFLALYGFIRDDTPGSSRALFWLVTVAWALYGVAYLFPPAAKNSTYNYLDLVAKNFFGVFLSVRVLSGK